MAFKFPFDVKIQARGEVVNPPAASVKPSAPEKQNKKGAKDAKRSK